MTHPNGKVRSLIADMAREQRQYIARRRTELLTELRRLNDEDSTLAAVEAAAGVETRNADDEVPHE